MSTRKPRSSHLPLDVSPEMIAEGVRLIRESGVLEELRRGVGVRELTEVDFVVESIYHRASIKPTTFSSEGGLPVEDRWWDAIEEAYREGKRQKLTPA